MHVVATAGHVDHGKSTLVRALTGREPDRWAEEHRRGLTLDLGFAWTTLPGAHGYEQVAFVDVPGHERFVSNMLAGVGPVPAVLFVVAADEGWMPQSTEHLAALDALGVTRGLLVVTRADLADPEPARAQALDRIAPTTLGAVPSVVVSGRTGAGLDRLRSALAELVSGLPDADSTADVRLWIDRSFTISGAGLVVTGTLPAGRLRVSDDLTLASTGGTVHVRDLQALERPVETIGGVARVAVNLRGVERDRPRRGDALLTPDAWRPTELIDCLLPGAADLPVTATLHVGAAAVPVRIRPLGDRTARLRLARRLPLRHGDRVLLRDPSRHEILTGARVLDADPPELRRRGAARQRAARLTQITDAAGATADKLTQLGFARPGELRVLGLPVTGPPVVDDPATGPWHADRDLWEALPERLRTAVAEWQARRPLEPGLPERVAVRRLGLPHRALLAHVARRAGLTATDGRILAPGDAAQLPPAIARGVETVLADLRDAPFAAPDANRLARLRLGTRELAAAARAGRLLKVADGIVLAPDALDRARPLLAELPQPFTLSQARRALGTTRRVAVPFLELLDRRGVTQRLADDTRRMG